MILNSAVIERYLIDGKTYTDTKEFIDALLACTDLVADVYVNSKRVASGMLNLSVNNNWIIGNVDERLSIINMDAASSINIVVHQLGHNELEDIIMKSTSPLNTFIDPGDCDADLYFSIMSTVPECTQRCYVPDSVFNAMGTNNITPKDFDNPVECPDDPTLPEPEPGEHTVEMENYAVFPGAEPAQIMFSITSLDGVDKDVEIPLEGTWQVYTEGTAPVKGALDCWEFYVEDVPFVNYIIEHDAPSITVTMIINGNEYTAELSGWIEGGGGKE